MRYRRPTLGSHACRHNVRSTTYKQSSQVLILNTIISFRINAYSVVETVLKTRHLKPFRINTYRKSARISLEMNTYKKHRGMGWVHSTHPRGEVPGKGSFAGKQVRRARVPGEARSLRPDRIYGRSLRGEPVKSACCAIIISFCGGFCGKLS